MDSLTPDEQLMLAYAANNERAFAVLYERHKGSLYRYVVKSVNQDAIAQELFQELWMKIIRYKNSYDQQFAFTTWAYTMARNIVIDWFRKHSKETLIDDSAETHELADIKIKQPESVFETKAMMQSLQEALQTLPYLQREVFLLRHEAGMPFQEIADVSQCSLEAAKSRYRYAMSKIQSTLEPLQ